MSQYLKSSIVCLALAISACGSDSDTSDETGTSELEGVWELVCSEDTDSPAGERYRKTVLTFMGGSTGSYTATSSDHSSADCSTPAIADDSATLVGTYSIGNQTTSDEGLQVTEIDLTSDSITPLGGDTIPLTSDFGSDPDIYFIDNSTLYFGVDIDTDAEPPVRPTSIDFTSAFFKRQ